MAVSPLWFGWRERDDGSGQQSVEGFDIDVGSAVRVDGEDTEGVLAAVEQQVAIGEPRAALTSEKPYAWPPTRPTAIGPPGRQLARRRLAHLAARCTRLPGSVCDLQVATGGPWVAWVRVVLLLWGATAFDVPHQAADYLIMGMWSSANWDPTGNWDSDGCHARRQRGAEVVLTMRAPRPHWSPQPDPVSPSVTHR